MKLMLMLSALNDHEQHHRKTTAIDITTVEYFDYDPDILFNFDDN